MQVTGNSIIYKDHMVVCNPGRDWSETWTAEYITEMAECLTPDGTMREHAQELRHMNNDGTWGIKRRPTPGK